MTRYFDDCYINEAVTVASRLEYDGPLGCYIDYYPNIKFKTFEEKEINYLIRGIDMLLEKACITSDEIALAISSDLTNEMVITSYTYRTINIPVIPAYAACASFVLDLYLACVLTKTLNKRILVTVSSNKEVAERQFRNPIEYGGPKEYTQSSTATGAALAIVSSTKSDIRLKSFTLGRIIDVGYKNALDFGRVMSPAAIETLIDHFKSTNTKPQDYDLIITGDLGYYGNKIVNDELTRRYGFIKHIEDAGLLLYNRNKQNVNAGGSGPTAIALVALAYIRKKMDSGLYKRVLLAATGALLSVTMCNQKESIPAVCHVVELEGVL